MNYDAFISYRRDSGAAEARLLRQSLMARGLSVFLDVTDLRRGYFDEELLQRISAAPNFIPILTPGALDRCDDPQDWMRQEIRHAISEKRNIVPVIVADFAFPPALPADIGTLPRHQGVQYSHQYFDAMTQAIVDSLDVSASATPAPAQTAGAGRDRVAAPPVAPQRRPLHWGWHLLVGSVLGLIGGAINLQFLHFSSLDEPAVLQVCGVVPGAVAALVARRLQRIPVAMALATAAGALTVDLLFLSSFLVLTAGDVSEFNRHLPFWLGPNKAEDEMMREAFALGLRLGIIPGLLAGAGNVALQELRRRWRQ